MRHFGLENRVCLLIDLKLGADFCRFGLKRQIFVTEIK